MRTLIFIVFFFQFITINAQVYKYGKVSIGELADNNNKGQSAKIIYKKINYLYGDVFEMHLRIKIYKKEGFKYADWKIPYKQVKAIKATTYNLENNQIVATDVTKKGIFKDKVSKSYQIRKIVFPNVKEGSILELKYKIKNIWVSSILVQNYIPIDVFEAKIKNPVNFQLILRENPYVKMPITGKTINDKVVFSGKNIPALKEEDYVGNMYNHMGQILIYSKRYFSTWEEVIGFFYHAEWFGKQLKKNDILINNKAKNIARNEKDSIEKAKKIYAYVKETIQWNHYKGLYSKGIKKTYNEKSGNIADINLLLIVMLQQAGLKANPMIISSKENGWILYPSEENFDVVLAALEIDNKIILLDASNTNGGFGEIPIDFNNGNGLVIYDNGTTLNYSTMTKERSKNKNIASVTLDIENLEVLGNNKNQKTRYYAWKFRDLYKESNETSIDKLMESGGLLKIYNAEKKNFDELNLPVTLSYDFIIEDYIEEINNKYYFDPLLFFGKKENKFKEGKREYPIDLDFPYEETFVINFDIPEGYKVESMPENKNFAIEYDIGSLLFQINSTEKQIHVLLKIAINKSVILPQYYKSLYELFHEYSEISNSKIVLVKQ